MSNVKSNYLATTKQYTFSTEMQRQLISMPVEMMQEHIDYVIAEEKEWCKRSILLGKDENGIKEIGEIEYKVETDIPKYIKVIARAKIL